MKLKVGSAYMADSVTSGKHGSTEMATTTSSTDLSVPSISSRGLFNSVSGEAAQSLGSPHYLDLGTQYLCDLSNTKI